MYIFLYSTDIDFIFDSSATLKDENVRKKHFPLHVSIRNNGMDNVITIDKLWGNYLIEIKQINPKHIDNYKYEKIEYYTFSKLSHLVTKLNELLENSRG